MRAYCWRSGVIAFGRRLPKTALPLASGKPKQLHLVISAVARHSYAADRKGAPILLVPGVPEAGEKFDDAINAVIKFRGQIETHLNPPPVKPGGYVGPFHQCAQENRRNNRRK